MYWEWSVHHIVEDLSDYFHAHFLEPLDYFLQNIKMDFSLFFHKVDDRDCSK